jgi:hypothetical protein
MMNRMLLCALLLQFNIASAQQPAAAAPHLSCILPDLLGCGCSIRLSGVSCANPVFASQPHLFSELDADAPLLIGIAGKVLVLAHQQHAGNANKGDSPGAFSDIYASPMLEVRIDYSPAASTCPVDKIDGCEYTDIQAVVSLRWQDGRKQIFRGKGICGC